MAAPGLPTPLYGHVGRGAFSDVYEPSEDTFLLLDALEAAAAELAGCEEGARLSGRERGVLEAAAGSPASSGSGGSAHFPVIDSRAGVRASVLRSGAARGGGHPARPLGCQSEDRFKMRPQTLLLSNVKVCLETYLVHKYHPAATAGQG